MKLTTLFRFFWKNLFIFFSMKTPPCVWAVLRHHWSNRLSQASAHGLVFPGGGSVKVGQPGKQLNDMGGLFSKNQWKKGLLGKNQWKNIIKKENHLLKNISCHSTADILVMEEIGFYEIYWYIYMMRKKMTGSNFADEIPKHCDRSEAEVLPPPTYDISRVDAIQGWKVLKLSQDSFRKKILYSANLRKRLSIKLRDLQWFLQMIQQNPRSEKNEINDTVQFCIQSHALKECGKQKKLDSTLLPVHVFFTASLKWLFFESQRIYG